MKREIIESGKGNWGVTEVEFCIFATRLAGGDAEFGELAASVLKSVNSGHSALLANDYPGGRSAIIHLAAGHPDLLGGDNNKFLVMSDSLVYLNKYFNYEETISNFLRAKKYQENPNLTIEQIRAIHRNFQNPDFPALDQLEAVKRVTGQGFGIITGGPGTGKTTVCSAVLAMELTINLDLKIALAAPTGKAKARLLDSLLDAADNKLCASPEIIERIAKLEVKTVNSLLGFNELSTQPKFNRYNPLRADLVVIDEVSMLSLPMTAKLIDALKEGARLLLIGDKNQLNSIESGSVIADICRSRRMDGFIAQLGTNYRALSNPELVHCAGELANSDGGVDIKKWFAIDSFRFSAVTLPDVHRLPRRLGKLLDEWDIFGWKDVRSVGEAFAYVDRFKVLCAVREGKYGVVNINLVISELLGLAYGDDGFPVMITRNDPVTGLNNGDVGVFFDGQVYFRMANLTDEQETLRAFAPAELPECEAVFAMTVHKAQGSGFDDVLLILPPDKAGILTRELLYTGMTRTQKRFWLWADKAVAEFCAGRSTLRISGLTARLDD